MLENTLHIKMKELVNDKGVEILESSNLIGWLDDRNAFRSVMDKPYKVLLRLMMTSGLVKQYVDNDNINLDYSGITVPQNVDVDYMTDCLAYATGRKSVITTACEDDTAIKADKLIRQEVSLEDDVVPYVAHGSKKQLGTMIPACMATSVHKHLNRLAHYEGDIKDFVAAELEMNVTELERCLSGEQIDGVALAISQMREGRGFILGDMTGVGKGRQLAALIRWAIIRDTKPVFVTEKSVLFSDLYRDLKDIGFADYKPFILNKDSEARIIGDDGKCIYTHPTKEEMDSFLVTEKLPKGYDFLCLTYSQMNHSSKEDFKSAAVLGAIKDSYLIMDESHNASGVKSNIGEFFMKAVKDCAAVCFSSATFARFPANMPLYALRTAIGDANVTTEELIDIVSHGGPILQEVMSKGLVESGSMVRRQRDMSNIRREVYIPQEEAVSKTMFKKYNEVMEVANEIYSFETNYISRYLEGLNKEKILRKNCNVPQGYVFRPKDLRFDYPRFAMRMIPVIRQLIFALKTDAAVEKTLEVLKSGEKPIVQINRTMESNLDGVAEIGEMVKKDDFVQLLHKCLDSMFSYAVVGTATMGTGQAKLSMKFKYEDTMTLDQLGSFEGETARDVYDYIKQRIDDTDTGLPLSPIDTFTRRIEDAGYSVGEMTMRSSKLDISEGGTAFRTSRKKINKKSLAKKFNEGDVDVLIGNRVMASGISLHASTEFKDQRPRCIITWEQQDSADRQSQFDGRADRTGQICHCHFITLMSTIPCEQRFLMMNDSKARSLNANVMANQKTENLIDNMLNMYGSQVCSDYLADHPEMQRLYPDLRMAMINCAKSQLVVKFMQTIALYPCEDQIRIMDDIKTLYKEYMDYLNESSSNRLETRTLPLAATLMKRTVFSAGNTHSESVFGRDAYLDEVEVNVLKKPLTGTEIGNIIPTLMKGADMVEDIKKHGKRKVRAIRQRYKDLRTNAKARIDDYCLKNNVTDICELPYIPKYIMSLKRMTVNEDIEQVQVESVKNSVKQTLQLLSYFHRGEAVAIPQVLFPNCEIDDEANADLVSTGMFLGFKYTQTIPTRSNIKACFAVNDSRRKLEIPLTQDYCMDVIRHQSRMFFMRNRLKGLTLNTWDAQVPNVTREKTYIVTGNIIQGIAKAGRFGQNLSSRKEQMFAKSKGNGALIEYTDDRGRRRQGFLMPRIFRPADVALYGCEKAKA